MIFGALSPSSSVHQAPASCDRVRGHEAEIALRGGDRLHHAVRAEMRAERNREAEMKAHAVAHGGVAGAHVGMHRIGRLHMREGRDDDAPDALHRVERQDAVMALDQPAHHRGLAGGPERGAGILRLLDLDQGVDDLAALDQELVHALVDAVDFVAQIGERGLGGRVRLGHDKLRKRRLNAKDIDRGGGRST